MGSVRSGSVERLRSISCNRAAETNSAFRSVVTRAKANRVSVYETIQLVLSAGRRVGALPSVE